MSEQDPQLCPDCAGNGGTAERYMVTDENGYEFEAIRPKVCDTCGGKGYT